MLLIKSSLIFFTICQQFYERMLFILSIIYFSIFFLFFSIARFLLTNNETVIGLLCHPNLMTLIERGLESPLNNLELKVYRPSRNPIVNSHFHFILPSEWDPAGLETLGTWKCYQKIKYLIPFQIISSH